jgi:hypothetical protein
MEEEADADADVMLSGGGASEVPFLVFEINSLLCIVA